MGRGGDGGGGLRAAQRTRRALERRSGGELAADGFTFSVLIAAAAAGPGDTRAVRALWRECCSPRAGVPPAEREGARTALVTALTRAALDGDASAASDAGSGRARGRALAAEAVGHWRALDNSAERILGRAPDARAHKAGLAALAAGRDWEGAWALLGGMARGERCGGGGEEEEDEDEDEGGGGGAPRGGLSLPSSSSSPFAPGAPSLSPSAPDPLARPPPDTVACNAVLLACARARPPRPARAEELLERMSRGRLGAACLPDLVSHNTVVGAWAAEAAWREAGGQGAPGEGEDDAGGGARAAVARRRARARRGQRGGRGPRGGRWWRGGGSRPGPSPPTRRRAGDPRPTTSAAPTRTAEAPTGTAEAPRDRTPSRPGPFSRPWPRPETGEEG